VWGNVEMITDGDAIVRWTRFRNWSWHGLHGMYKASLEKV
jgi:hypothetical protein